MRLWLDTTDVWEWTGPQLSGIQRVVATVLGHWLRQGADIRLFRFDRASRRLLQLGPEALPAALRRCGGIVLRHDEPARKLAAREFPSLPLREGLQGGVLRASARTRVLSTAQRLKRVFRAQTRATPLPTLPRTGGGGTIGLLHGLDRPPAFGPGEVVLSLGLTWGYHGYWEALAECKQGAMVQLVHDLGPITQPQWLPPNWRKLALEWFAAVTRHSDLLLTVSAFQKGEIEQYLETASLPRVPVRVVHLGDDPPLLIQAATQGAAEDAARSRRPFVLCVSGFVPRKNHAALYAVWQRLAAELGERCPDLVLVGAAAPVPFDLPARMCADPLVGRRVRILLDASDETVGRLYRDCLFTVYPSFYEGWGLPIAESLRCGRYCIASSAGPLPEVGGDLVDYADPADDAGLHALVRRAIDNPGFVAAREAAIRARYRPWGWAMTARQILEAVARAPAAAG